MEVGGQEKSPVSTEEEAEWAPKLFQTFLRRHKSPAAAWIPTPRLPNPYPSHCSDSTDLVHKSAIYELLNYTHSPQTSTSLSVQKS